MHEKSLVFLRDLSGQDRGRWGIHGISAGLAAHEFTHILGVGNKEGPHLSNTNYIPDTKATAYDYGWAFGGAINAHRKQSRQLEMKGVLPANPSGMWVPVNQRVAHRREY